MGAQLFLQMQCLGYVLGFMYHLFFELLALTFSLKTSKLIFVSLLALVFAFLYCYFFLTVLSTPLQGVTMPPINATFRPHGNSPRKESAKKTKVVQSVWCEVCRVECNTKEVLDKHKMGKKHKKNEDKLKESTAPHPPAASGVSNNPVIGPQETPASSSVQKIRKKATEPEEDLETKRRKIMNEGAASDAVRVCTICNVVCNSELVFAYHNAGKKHAAMMTKQSVSGTGVATTT